MCRDAGRSENLGGRVVMWGRVWPKPFFYIRQKPKFSFFKGKSRGGGVRPPAPPLPTSLNVWKPWQDLWSLFFNTLFNQHKVTKTTIRLNLIHFPTQFSSWFLACTFSEFNASSCLFYLFCSFCFFCFECLAYSKVLNKHGVQMKVMVEKKSVK